MILLRIAGGALVVFAAAMTAHLIVEPWYHVSTPDEPYSHIWDYINPLEAAAVVMGAAISLYLKITMHRTAPFSWDRLTVNAMFYGFVFVAILFFWVWSIVTNLDTFTAIGQDTISVIWIFLDALLATLAAALGIKILRGWPRMDA